MSDAFSWRDVSTAAGAFAAISFVGSVIYDFGFLSALGLSFSRVPTTLADQTRSALIWSPAIAAGSIGTMVLSMIFWPKAQQPYDLNNPSDRRVWKIEGIVVLVAGLTLVGGWLWHGEANIVHGALGLGLLWVELAISAFRRGFLAQGRPSLRYLILVGLPAAFMLFSQGWADAYTSYRSSPERAPARVAEDQIAMVRVLRTFEQGFLYRVENRVQFERWDGGTFLATRTDRREWYGAFCAWRRCNPPHDAPL